MNKDFIAASFVSLWLTACAPYTPQPLGLNHPAHVDAAVASRPPASQTLAYTRADMPSSRAVAVAAAEPNAGAPKAESGQTISAEGKVVATVPNAGQVVLEHGEIKGFMEAMTMGYRVEPPALLEGLKFGDQIRFTINVPKKAIVKLEKLN